MGQKHKVRVLVVFNRLPRLPKKIERETSKALDKSAEQVKETAKQLVAVDSGNLRDSITTEKTSELRRTVHTDVDYGIGIELGTEDRPATPYLRPALETHEIQIVSNVETAVQRALK